MRNYKNNFNRIMGQRSYLNKLRNKQWKINTTKKFFKGV